MFNMEPQILQKAFFRNLVDVQEVIHELIPKVYVSSNFLRHYVIIRKNCDDAAVSCGGVEIIGDSTVACTHLTFQTSLEAVAARAVFFK